MLRAASLAALAGAAAQAAPLTLEAAGRLTLSLDPTTLQYSESASSSPPHFNFLVSDVSLPRSLLTRRLRRRERVVR